MTLATPLLTDGLPGDAAPGEPSMAEILASIRQIIAGDQALCARLGETHADADARAAAEEPASAAQRSDRDGKGRPLLSHGAESAVTAAFQTLLASRFVRHSDAVFNLSREMLRPMLEAWLDANLPAMVERLVIAEIERVMRGE